MKKLMKRILPVALILILMLSLLAGCNKAPAGKEPQGGGQDLVIVDPSGVEITIPKDVDAIVSLAPSITGILLDLGLGDKLVAIDNNSIGMEGLNKDLASIDMMSPNVESLIALKPDLIFASTITMGGEEDPLIQVKEAGITIAYIPTSNSIEEIYKDISFVAKAVGLEDKGKAIVDEMKDSIKEFKKIGDSISEKKSVYFEVSPAPYLYSFGKGVYLNEMIELLGANNVLADKDDWMSVAEEDIIAANPDIIITNVNFVENPTEEIETSVDEIIHREGWENVTAVKDKQVYYVNNNYSAQPNQNIIKALEEMAKFIYPDKF